MGKGIAIQYSDDMKKFIQENQYGISRKELKNIFNEKFNTSLSTDVLKGYCTRNKLNNGFSGRYQKGQISHNKGVPMDRIVYEKCKSTMFKKGNIPKNHKPVGSERINVYGYVEIKVQEPRKWRQKHNVIWESVNGPIPKDSVVIFLDQNKLNISIENLRIIKRKELLIMNRNGLFTSNSELTEVGTNYAKLVSAANRVKKCNIGSSQGKNG